MPRRKRELKRRHQLVISLSFDKPITQAEALRHARNCIWGEFYTAQFSDKEPGTMNVRGFNAIARVKQ